MSETLLCENPDKVIKVEKKTNIGKYEFLRAYYPSWNFITKASPRVIVDTHAGTGIVDFYDNGKKCETIYGSAILAILKTITIPNNLSIVLNEKNSKNFNVLKEHIEKIKENGLPIFEEQIKKKEFQTVLGDKKKLIHLKKKPKLKFPDIIDKKIPKNYKKKMVKTKAEIFYYHSSIENRIDEILNTFFVDVEKIDKKGNKKIYNVKGIFLVDPCGAVNWDVIQKIGQKANQMEGIELILNWSSQSIYRNPNAFNNLSKVFGMPKEEVRKNFPENTEIHEYLDVYIKNLEKYWKFVEKVKIPTSLKLKVRKNELKSTYFLLYCTNNDKGISLAKGKMKKIRKSIKQLGYGDIRDYIKK